MDGTAVAAIITASGGAIAGLALAGPAIVKSFREARRDTGEDFLKSSDRLGLLRRIYRALVGTTFWEHDLDKEIKKDLEREVGS